MKKTDRKMVELVETIRGKSSGQSLLVAKVASINPFTLKMYDLTVSKHIYVNESFLKTSSGEIDGNINWDDQQDYIPKHMLAFTRRMMKADLLAAGDTVIVLQDGISFYVLERVKKVA